MRTPNIKKICFGSLVILIAIAALFPFYWAFVSSLKTGSALFDTHLWPHTVTFINYKDIVTDTLFERSLANSFYVATGVVILSLGLAILAAYALVLQL